MNVSVIIPTYNRPGYLSQAVQSVLKQTHPVYEIIIVDDGSLPEYRGRISDLEMLDHRIRVCHFFENRGVSAARNYGLEKSTGKYLLFLDDDDILHPRLIESNLQEFTRDPSLDVVACSSCIFIDLSKAEKINKELDNFLIRAENVVYIQDNVDNPLFKEGASFRLMRGGLQVSSCLIKRKAISGIRFPETLARGEDKYFWWQLSNTTKKFEKNCNCYSYRRIHPNSSLSSYGWQVEDLNFFIKLLKGNAVKDNKDKLILNLFLAKNSLFLGEIKGFLYLGNFIRMLIIPEIIKCWPTLFFLFVERIYLKYKKRKIVKMRKMYNVTKIL